jgi:hypothetical protein
MEEQKVVVSWDTPIHSDYFSDNGYVDHFRTKTFHNESVDFKTIRTDVKPLMLCELTRAVDDQNLSFRPKPPLAVVQLPQYFGPNIDQLPATPNRALCRAIFYSLEIIRVENAMSM